MEGPQSPQDPYRQVILSCDDSVILSHSAENKPEVYMFEENAVPLSYTSAHLHNKKKD